MGLLDGKVAIVTGAGGGLGRAHAIALAREGAKVVVNDLGGSLQGGGKGSAMADETVALIRHAGGDAVASYASVADAEAARGIVQTAIDVFGRLDVLVNNAGILRDRTLLKLTDDDWDLVVAVHLRGTYLCTKAALAHLREAGHGGAIINTSSYAGLIGNFGQSNYGAAKAGIAGFTRVVALESQRMGVTVNAIAPLAKTRMTEGIDAVPADITPEQIAPFVVFLASDLAKGVTGRIFGVHGPQIFEYKQVMTPGVTREGGPWTPGEIAERLPDIEAMPGAKAPVVPSEMDEGAQAEALFLAIPRGFRAEKAAGWTSTLHFVLGDGGRYTLRVLGDRAEASKGLLGTPTATITIDAAATLLGMARGELKPEQAFMAGRIKADNMGELMKFGQLFNLKKVAAGASAPEVVTAPMERPQGANIELIDKLYRGHARFVRPDETVAYALAVGDRNPRYLDKGHEGGLLAPLMFPVKPVMDAIGPLVSDPALGVDLMRLLHGEQDMTFHRPLRPWDLVYPVAFLERVEDKSSGQLLHVRQRLLVDGEVVCDIRSGYFVRGDRKAEGGAKAEVVPAPPREVSLEASFTVGADQPIRYGHASGDTNPIHMDEGVAKAAGLPSIILHGLCSMAIAAAALVDGLAGGDPALVRRLAVRFSRVVLPGDRLTTRAWIDEGFAVERRAHGFEVRNQRGELVITNGIIELR